MALTEKGKSALGHIKTHFPTGAFTAKDLSDAAGEKIVAATLNAVANNGYLNKLGGSPVQFEAVADLLDLLENMETPTATGLDNTKMATAKRAKNDEFYTRYEDIEAEVMKYRKQFRGKTVYLPCDDPAEKKSEFWSFFVNNFDAFGLKKLIATHYDENGKAYKIWIDSDTTGDGYIDDADALQEDLIGNGDFRSPECIDILNECDIVCTNPPFSLFREFFDAIMQANKLFLIICPQNAFKYKDIFPYIKEGKVWAGYSFNKTFDFIMSDDYVLTKTGYIDDQGRKHGKVASTCWMTNMVVNKRTDSKRGEKYAHIMSKKLNCKTAICSTTPDYIYNILSGERIAAGEAVTAICAIGQPEQFFRFVENRFEVIRKIAYDDHHVYKQSELDAIKGTIVTTEKDAVKMSNFNRKDIYAMKLKIDLDIKTLLED